MKKIIRVYTFKHSNSEGIIIKIRLPRAACKKLNLFLNHLEEHKKLLYITSNFKLSD